MLKFHSETITTQETKFKSKLINQLHLNGNFCSFMVGWWAKQSIRFGFFKLFTPDYCSHICPVTESQFPSLTYLTCYKLHHCLNSTHTSPWLQDISLVSMHSPIHLSTTV